MGIGEKSPSKSFNLHHHHHREGKNNQQEFRGVPKGCMAIKVGQGDLRLLDMADDNEKLKYTYAMQ